MDNSVRQDPEQPQTLYAQQKERLLQKVLARIAEAEKRRESEKSKARAAGTIW
jgi:hypothetical protein